MTYRERKELEQRTKKEDIKEWALFTFVASFIIILSIYALNLQLERAVNKCSQKYDKNYCIKKLR